MNKQFRFMRDRPSQSMRRLRLMAAFVVLAISTTGCVILAPIPVAHHAAGSRRNVNTDTTGRFTPKWSTVDDIVLALGEPDATTGDATRLFYRWERVNMYLASGWAIPLGNTTGIGQSRTTTYSHRNTLEFEFDGSGVLQTVKATNMASEKTKEDFRH